MKKILVIGCPGAGKSTFARKLRDLTGLPLIYLDKLWHKADKTNYSREEFDESLGNVLQTDSWIIDGNYHRTLEMRLRSCDTVFFFDIPMEICLEGAASRIGTVREDLPWVEEEFDPEFRQYIINFPGERLPLIYEMLKHYQDQVNIITFHSRKQADDWLRDQELRRRFEIIRAVEEYQRAGAYYVRIQAMAKAYNITLREEFDNIDGENCRYILILDRGFPIATCRWFEAEASTAEIGRVVVLPEYRNQHLGSLVVKEAEKWIAEEGYEKIMISSRTGVEPFYERLGYVYNTDHEAHSSTFQCVYMEKVLSADQNGL